MKYFFATTLSLSSLFLFGQSGDSQDSSINTINKIFNSYIKKSENIDSKKNKELFTKVVKSLKNVTDQKNLLVLVNVWMYYDPTDLPTRELVEPIFFNNKKAAAIAVRNRIKNKKKWEMKDRPPYSELYSLLAALAK